MYDDEAVRWNDDCVSEKDGVGKTETGRAAEDGAERNIAEDVGGDTVTGSSADIDDDRGKNLNADGDTETDPEFTIGSVFSNDVAESDTCTDPESCSDVDFDGDIDDSPECARDNGADGDANMDAVGTNGIDDNFDTDTDGVFDDCAEGKTILDFNEESDADGDTDRDSGFDSENEGTFFGFRADDEAVRNVSDRDTDNECETDMYVVFDNDIEGTACFETDADSDRGVVCITDDRDADIDFVGGNKLDGDTVSDCNADNNTNDNTVRDDGLVIATDAEYADKDFDIDINNVSERGRDNGANSDTDKDAVDTDTDADFTTNFVAEFVTNSDADEDVCNDTDADRDADCDSDTSDGRVGDTDK